MPIYEFYCSDCHRIYQFFSTVPRVDKPPACPRCGRGVLEKRVSRFATLRYAGEEEPPAPFDGLDEEKMEGAMEALAAEMGGMEESDDPRATARFMRRFLDLTGMEMGPKMQEMVRRLEAGEDPEALDEEFGDIPDGEEDEVLSEFIRMKKRAKMDRGEPDKDEKLYFL